MLAHFLLYPKNVEAAAPFIQSPLLLLAFRLPQSALLGGPDEGRHRAAGGGLQGPECPADLSGRTQGLSGRALPAPDRRLAGRFPAVAERLLRVRSHENGQPANGERGSPIVIILCLISSF